MLGVGGWRAKNRSGNISAGSCALPTIRHNPLSQNFGHISRSVRCLFRRRIHTSNRLSLDYEGNNSHFDFFFAQSESDWTSVAASMASTANGGRWHTSIMKATDRQQNRSVITPSPGIAQFMSLSFIRNHNSQNRRWNEVDHVYDTFETKMKKSKSKWTFPS